MAGDDNLWRGLMDQGKDALRDAYDAHPGRFALVCGLLFGLLLWVIY